MPANVGEMFYYGEVPWQREGTELEEPANRQEAIMHGGLDWEVEMVPLSTDEEPAFSLVPAANQRIVVVVG